MADYDGFESTYEFGKKMGHREELLEIRNHIENLKPSGGYVYKTYGHGYMAAYEEVIAYLDKRMKELGS